MPGTVSLVNGALMNSQALAPRWTPPRCSWSRHAYTLARRSPTVLHCESKRDASSHIPRAAESPSAAGTIGSAMSMLHPFDRPKRGGTSPRQRNTIVSEVRLSPSIGLAAYLRPIEAVLRVLGFARQRPVAGIANHLKGPFACRAESFFS
jgi:hypothetical protein